MSEERTMRLTDIGKHFGVSRVIAGRWTTKAGLRDADGQPSEMAKRGGYCKQVYDEDRGIWFWVWIAALTLPVLEAFLQSGGKVKSDKGEMEPPPQK